MKISSRFAGVVSLASLFAVSAAQADDGKTREQVRAELVAAQQAGEIQYGNTGMTEREVFPARHDATQAPAAVKPVYTSENQGLTRAQVRAELIAAQKAGEVQYGNIGATARELFPDRFPGQESNSNVAKTGRAQ
jgi:hypothetical protein